MITITKRDNELLIIQNNMRIVLFYLFVPLTACIFFVLYSLIRLSSPFEAKFMIVLAFILTYTSVLKMEWKRKIYIFKNNIVIIKYPFKKKRSIKFSEIEEIKVKILEKREKVVYLDVRDEDTMYKIVLYSSKEKFNNYILCYSLYLREINKLHENILKYREEIKDEYRDREIL